MTRQPSAFADLVPRLLERVAWPGQRPDDSVQFQARHRWQRLLDELALLDFDGTRYSWNEFLDLLEHQAEETIFAPESHDAPIQILGPFESSGQQFDAVWFLGTDDTAWPQRGRLHPLLPPAAQRQYAMPHAAPDDDWNLANIVTTRLLHSAPRIVFSFAERDKDAELRPSPLIAGLVSRRLRSRKPCVSGRGGHDARAVARLCGRRFRRSPVAAGAKCGRRRCAEAPGCVPVPGFCLEAAARRSRSMKASGASARRKRANCCMQ